MGWLAKLKEKAEEHTISVLFALIVLLSLIVWRAVPSEVWDKVSAAVPKRALWALTGLLAITTSLTCAYIFHLRKQQRLIQIENAKLQDQINNPPLISRFGVCWSQDLTPHCPACSKPLSHYARHNVPESLWGRWGFRCIQCDQIVSMTDDNG